jgi:hypothetical protein
VVSLEPGSAGFALCEMSFGTATLQDPGFVHMFRGHLEMEYW